MESSSSPPQTIATQTNQIHSSTTPTQTVSSQISVNAQSAAAAAPNVVAIPVPVVPPLESTYYYVFVRGSIYSDFGSLFGLTQDEITALSTRYNNKVSCVDNGIMIKAPPVDLINSLAQLGYKVVCATGESEITWTLQREG
ncbi:uncharacterized protein LOC134832373 [Culicoides brevitarsis]|uniref:uncharacterized protein LOC134832373 n=1 Tax=Culicoides brevitarsis TaxID=469753 RepID=UPI00307B239A